MTESDTDSRLIEYIEALKTGDINKVVELRSLHLDLSTRFETVERINSGTLALYSREIQILRLEIEGWKSISDGHDSDDVKLGQQYIRRGLEKLERALVYRRHQSEINLPKLSRSP